MIADRANQCAHCQSPIVAGQRWVRYLKYRAITAPFVARVAPDAERLRSNGVRGAEKTIEVLRNVTSLNETSGPD
jgi:hypothetical protein